MATQFRKSKKIGPIRLTASKGGIGYSVGAGGVRIGKGADGKVRRTVGIPGTGIYNTKTLQLVPTAVDDESTRVERMEAYRVAREDKNAAWKSAHPRAWKWLVRINITAFALLAAIVLLVAIA